MPNDTLLRRTLTANALFSTLCAGGAAFATPLADATGIPPLVLTVVCLGLLPFAGAAVFAAREPSERLGLIRAIYAADLAWVALTPVALLAPLTTLGRALLVDVGLVVAVFAYFERRGLLGADVGRDPEVRSATSGG